MEERIRRIIENNREWASRMVAEDPAYFEKRVGGQAPQYLVVGCADSRVPMEILTGVQPGDMFVHRNIANQVVPSDLNVLSVLQYAVQVLDVESVLVVGHYNCGGVAAALDDADYGLVEHWLSGIRNVARWHDAELATIEDRTARHRRVVELNVLEQVYQLSRCPIVLDAWERGRRPALHGLVYDLQDGLLRTVVAGIDSTAVAHERLPEHIIRAGR